MDKDVSRKKRALTASIFKFCCWEREWPQVYVEISDNWIMKSDDILYANVEFLKGPRRTVGNALAEYILPLAVIGIVVLITVTVIIQNVQGGIPNLFGTVTPTGSEKNLSLRPLGSNPYAETIQIVMADGTTITLENYPKDVSKLIETVGADGTTDILVENIRSLAKQLKDKGQITETQYNALEELANNGHNYGMTERLLLDAMARNTTFLTSGFVEDNEILTIRQRHFALGVHTNALGEDGLPRSRYLADVLELKPYIESLRGRIDSFSLERKSSPEFHDNAIGDTMYSFLKAYQKADQSGALANPAIQKVIQSLSKNIVLIGDNFQDTVTLRQVNGGSTNPESFNFSQASSFSHENAGGICDTGGGEDTGIHCPKYKG